MFRAALVIALACGCSASTSSTSTPPGGTDGGVDGGGTNPTANIQFAATTCTSPGPCGGDPRGTWTVVNGCTQPTGAGWCSSALESGTGTVSGEYLLGDGGYKIDTKIDFFACGDRPGSSQGGSGSATIMGSRVVFNTVGAYDFCVQGDTLYLLNAEATYPSLAVLKLTRKVVTDAAP